MTDSIRKPRPFFPPSRAGVFTGIGLVAIALVASAFESAGVSAISPTAVFVVLVAAFATVPRAIQPKGNGILAPIGQSASGAIYVSTLVIGVAGITASATTGTPIWAILALVACILGLATGLTWAIFSRNATPRAPAI
ncbi:hypothetical protein [Luethyella okanaganae]|uniref:Uncharacterized protein n=1 Tax=Luethyella okanaganae TaxID=69372 RepID=A0ABW1VGB0_9MICO